MMARSSVPLPPHPSSSRTEQKMSGAFMAFANLRACVVISTWGAEGISSRLPLPLLLLLLLHRDRTWSAWSSA